MVKHITETYAQAAVIFKSFMMAHEYYDNPQAHPYADLLRTQSVTLIGGGGGNMKAAEALAPYVGELNDDVSVSDSGGATRKNTDEHNVPANGDIARVTWGLSPWKKQLTRFEGKDARFGVNDDHKTVRTVGRSMIDGLRQAGHIFDVDLGYEVVEHTAEAAKMAIGGVNGRKLSGLMYTAVMSKRLMGQDVNKATQIMGHIVGAKGNIYAVTDQVHHIVAEYYDPKQDRIVQVFSEDDIDRDGIPYPLDTTLRFDRPIIPNPKAENAVVNADWTIFTQGSPWGSIIPPGLALKRALQRRQTLGRPTGGILNLIEDNGSVNLTANDHATIVEAHTGTTIDASIYNINTDAIPAGWTPVRGTPSTRYAVGAELSGKLAEHSANDAVANAGLRSPLETDPRALALAMMDLVQMSYEGAPAHA